MPRAASRRRRLAPSIATGWAAAPNDIDPNVQARIARGCAVPAADYVDMIRERGRLVRAMDARLAGLDALIMPTTSIVAPTIAEVADPKVFAVRNAALLRNTAIINFFDLCAVTLPLPVRRQRCRLG